MNDLLRQAAHALRDEGDEPGDRAQATRARVMMSLHGRRQRRTRTIAVFIPLAALLLGSTAWAARSGALPAMWSAVTAVVASLGRNATDVNDGTRGPLVGRAVQAVSSPPHRSQAPDVEPPAEAAPSPGEATAVALPAQTLEIAPGPSRSPAEARRDAVPRVRAHAPAESPGAARVRVGSSGPVAEMHSTSQAADRNLELYRTAHRAHFVDQDPARALAAWDKYLAAAPQGQFAPEAHYNRALTLVRLGRFAEARSALEPFARGRSGGYRQREAQELLDALEADAAGP